MRSTTKDLERMSSTTPEVSTKRATDATSPKELLESYRTMLVARRMDEKQLILLKQEVVLPYRRRRTRGRAGRRGLRAATGS
jgi:TPP-dependent pyruvate/acetoin dehydrogenase alpha subunit